MQKYPNLKMGDKSEKVSELQRLLNRSGQAGPLISEDGQFGTATNNALKQYQMAKKLPITGVCGTYDWLALLGKTIGTPSAAHRDNAALCVLEGVFLGDGKGNFFWQEGLTREEYASTLVNAGIVGGE